MMAACGNQLRLCLCRSFESVPELIAAIEQYLAASNADPKPFVWEAALVID